MRRRAAWRAPRWRSLAFPMFVLMSRPIDLYGRFEPLIPGVLVIVMLLLVIASPTIAGSPFRSMPAAVPCADWNISASRCWCRRTASRSGPGEGWNGPHAGGSSFIRPREDGPCWRRAGTPAGRAEVNGVWRVRRNRYRNKITALMLLLSSGLLGFVALNGRLPLTGVWDGVDGNMLFPLLTGLFGLPTLLLSGTSGKIPEQNAEVSRDLETRAAIGGALAGGFVGWVPGVTSTTGTMIGSIADPERDEDEEGSARRFITMVSSVGTAAAVFGIIALAVTGKGRTGALLVVKQMLGAEGVGSLSSATSADTVTLLVSVFAAALLGYVITIRLGRRFAARVGELELDKLSRIIVVSLVLLVLLMSGIPGMLLLLASTLLGLVPPRIGTNRVHLTGCLLVPITLFFFGLDVPFASFLGGLT